MVNPRLIKLAKRHMNPVLQIEKPKPKKQTLKTIKTPKEFQILEPQTHQNILEEYQRQITTQYQNNPNFVDLTNVEGSNIFTNALINEILNKQGKRTAIPSDDKNNKIFELIKNKYYTDFNALVVRSNKPSVEKNTNILQDIIETTKQKQRKIKFPFMITGFYVKPFPEDSDNYGLKFIPSPDFNYIEDERLDGTKYPTNTMFNKVDDLGLPIFDENGTRTWYSKQTGLSWFYLYSDSGLFSNGGLAYSNSVGRVAFVGGVA